MADTVHVELPRDLARYLAEEARRRGFPSAGAYVEAPVYAAADVDDDDRLAAKLREGLASGRTIVATGAYWAEKRRMLACVLLAFAATSCTHGPVREFAYRRSQKSALSRWEAPSPRVLSPVTWTAAALSDVAVTTADTVIWVGAGPVLALCAPFSDPRTLVLLPFLVVASPAAMLMAYEMSEPRDSDPSVSPSENAPETATPEPRPNGAAPTSSP